MSEDISKTPSPTDSAVELGIDRQMDSLVGYLLLYGVGVSIALILAGMVWHWFSDGRMDVDYVITGTNLFEFAWKNLQDLSSGAFRPRLLVNLGMVTLLLTPFVRVLASMLYFAFGERNAKFTVFTAMVLAVLSYSLFLR